MVSYDSLWSSKSPSVGPSTVDIGCNIAIFLLLSMFSKRITYIIYKHKQLIKYQDENYGFIRKGHHLLPCRQWILAAILQYFCYSVCFISKDYTETQVWLYWVTKILQYCSQYLQLTGQQMVTLMTKDWTRFCKDLLIKHIEFSISMFYKKLIHNM